MKSRLILVNTQEEFAYLVLNTLMGLCCVTLGVFLIINKVLNTLVPLLIFEYFVLSSIHPILRFRWGEQVYKRRILGGGMSPHAVKSSPELLQDELRILMMLLMFFASAPGFIAALTMPSFFHSRADYTSL